MNLCLFGYSFQWCHIFIAFLRQSYPPFMFHLLYVCRLAYSGLGKHKEAKECYEKALEIEPGNDGFSRNLTIAEQALAQQAGSSNQSANPMANLRK